MVWTLDLLKGTHYNHWKCNIFVIFCTVHYRQNATYFEDDSILLRFTCDHNETSNVEESDYLQILLTDLGGKFLQLNGHSALLSIQRGKIGGMQLIRNNQCSFNLCQYYSMNMHASSYLFKCGITPSSNSPCHSQSYYSVFGNYDVANACFEKEHRCIISHESTTQLWFGH